MRGVRACARRAAPRPLSRRPAHAPPSRARRFYDARFAAASEGREVVRTESTGAIRVALNVVTRGMAAHGYAAGAAPDAADLDQESAFGGRGRVRARPLEPPD